MKIVEKDNKSKVFADLEIGDFFVQRDGMFGKGDLLLIKNSKTGAIRIDGLENLITGWDELDSVFPVEINVIEFTRI